MRRRRVFTGPFFVQHTSNSPFSYPFIAEFLARRFQRSPPGRLRLPKEHSANNSYTSGSSGSSSSLRRRYDVGVFENTSGMPIGEVEEGRRGFLGFGRRAGRTMPVNPLSVLRSREMDSREDRSTSLFLQAVQMLSGKRRSRDVRLTLQLTPEQQQDIVNRYARTRWYGFIWYPFRNVTERQFKWWRRFAHFALLIVALFGLAVALVLYYREVEAVLRLSPEDRYDYQKMVTGMRYSEIYRLSMEVFQKEDPLEALPAPARYHLLIEAARKKGWHRVDWELESRTRYPRSSLEDMDFIHLFYWSIMYIGSLVTGGGELFSDRFGDLMEVQETQRRREMEANFVEHGPEPPEIRIGEKGGGKSA
ncbi:hypothetical protein C3747_228g16 [Trypanosoma cruzi]|uniref:Transmembrane protein n=2 Tax=Trypanosoma cruzi TaxID=5693 RepID=Q4DL17_TRYCC|nr:hypothetical protein, conserved [Trypanosoma cruzi]EAN93230.1 hypothetical protein, conserved [Trypanosoma cruzi]PWU98578.1 hypothetical protein C3747_228g16 [Trypanosoma cruzi]RNC44814.1 hypothetical protein TcCL_NonESM05478 [Trypanosoma cruzi]|eukprot:XP_815081.1 hypothetical protein [Trypanosoma cruzi strain CL Brener]